MGHRREHDVRPERVALHHDRPVRIGVNWGSLDQDLVGLSFSWAHGTGYYVPVRGPAGCQTVECSRVLAALKSAQI